VLVAFFTGGALGATPARTRRRPFSASTTEGAEGANPSAEASVADFIHRTSRGTQ
jgi:hypothetical protein